MAAPTTRARQPTRAPPAGTGALPEVVAWSAAGFEGVAFSARGRVRRDNQDAWCVTPGPPLRISVFDGAATRPHGQAAAQAAARKLPRCRRDILGDLDAAVRRTRGTAAAVVAELSGRHAHLSWAGDCQAYQYEGGWRGLCHPHRLPDGRLTQALGHDVRGATTSIPLDGTLVLCSDGVPRSALPPPDPDLRQWATTVLRSIYGQGAPDNLTLVAVRHAA